MAELRFDSISKSFGNTVVFDEVSATLHSGIIGILGANGAGKTTLIRILAGLLPCDIGKFYYNGERLDVGLPFWRERIGYLPQSPGLYERMTLQGFLDYMLLLSDWRIRAARKERIGEIILQLNMLHVADTPISHLSAGTRQRVAIEQALIHKPGVLFLDEPTKSLDSEERHRFHDYLQLRDDVQTFLTSNSLLDSLNLFSVLVNPDYIIQTAHWIMTLTAVGTLLGLTYSRLQNLKYASLEMA